MTPGAIARPAGTRRWNTANDAVLAEGKRVLIDDVGRFDKGLATAEELPDAVVVDPFRVVRLAGDALDRCRRRVQQATHGHRGRKNDPLYSACRPLHTGADLLTDKQKDRLMTNLIESISHGVPKALSEVITLGRTLKTRRRRPGLLRPARHIQRADRGHQRPARAPPRICARVP